MITTERLQTIYADAVATANSDSERDGGMNAAWRKGYGAEGEYTIEARLFCQMYNYESDRLGKVGYYKG